MWELDYKESWVQKNWCFWTVVLRVPWTARRSNQSMLKEISPGCSLGRTDAEAETPILWPPYVKSWLTGKDSDAGRDWGKEKKGTIEDEMAGWHHQLDGHEFGWTPGVGDGQGGLACCDSWGRQESDTTEWLNWTERLWDEENKHRYAQWHPVFILFSLFKVYVGTACSLWRILISIKNANKPKRKL